MILKIEISMKVIFQIMNNLILRWILDKAKYKYNGTVSLWNARSVT